MRKILTVLLLSFLVGTLINSVWAWQIERPRHSSSYDYMLPPRVENCSTDGIASVGLGVNPWAYIEHDIKPQGYDGVRLNVTMTANTRMHITYNYDNSSLFWIEDNPLLDTKIVNAGDDYGFELNLTNPNEPSAFSLFRFYGGASGIEPMGVYPGSAEYDKIWICTNGFVSFDNSNSTASTPNDIPSPQAPNALIAAVWSDLDVDNASSIIYGWRPLPYSTGTFFVTWDNVLHKASGARLTFQIVLASAPGYYGEPSYGESQFMISYKSVGGLSSNNCFAWGIKDQEGYRGLGDMLDGTKLNGFNQRSYTFLQWRQDNTSQHASNYFIHELTLKLNDTAIGKTKFEISNSPQELRGFNVNFNTPSTPDVDLRYKIAAMGAKALLSKFGGVIIGIMFTGLDLVDLLAENLYSNMKYTELRDQYCADPIPYGAYIIAPTPNSTTLDNKGSGVDASIGTLIDWILTDENNDVEHLLTVTATLEYFELTWQGYVVETPLVVTTSVNLKIIPDSPDKLNNNSFENATQLQGGNYTWLYADCYYDQFDFYKVYVESGKSLQVKIDVESGKDLNLYLYDAPSYEHLIAKSEHGIGQDEVVYGEQVKYPGAWWYIEVNATWWYGFYNMTIVTTTYGIRDLTIKTRYLSGQEITGVNVWVDDTSVSPSPATVTVGQGTHTVKVESGWIEDEFMYTFSRWEDNSTNNPRTVLVSSNQTITAYYKVKYFACPTLFVWNGTDYAYETLLNIHAESDITLQHRIAQPLVKDGIFYKLSLRELDNFTSHIDQVRLYAVDSRGEWHICPLASAIHSELGWVTLQLRFDDNTRVDLTPTQTINLKFTYLKDDIAYFTFEINGHNRKIP
jgi:hypothetical protein